METDVLLITLRIKGFAKRELLSESLDSAPNDVDRELAALAARGAGEETKVGFRLTPAGRLDADAAFERDRQSLDAAEIDDVYERFTVLNDRFKSAVMAWQQRDVDGTLVPNDHADAAYDARAMDRIAGVDAELDPILVALAERLPRIATYRSRFARALARARAGERRYVAAPMIDSYHTVWFELHEDLIRLCGRTRAAEAAAGRGA